MWLPANIIAEVERVARVYYVGMEDTRLWNENRREGDLRLLTGWCWETRDRRRFRQGFKTQTVAIRDAYYELISNAGAPPIARPRLRVVADKGRAA